METVAVRLHWVYALRPKSVPNFFMAKKDRRNRAGKEM